MLKKVLNANTVKNIEELYKLIIEKYDTEWVPIGGKDTNHSTFQMLQDGEYGVIERITNGIDAVIEKEYYLNPDESIRSPRTSAEKYFGIEGGDLSKFVAKDIDASNKALVEVKVLDSGKINRPTIEIRDKGIGLNADEFATTILSLQGGNKLHKFYLAGTFGQGGSTANIFSEKTLYISKGIKEKNPNNLVSFTFTREYDDVEHNKTPIHQYLIDKKTGNPITVVDDENLFEPGTLVRHIEMNVGRYGKTTAIGPTNSLYYFINNTLFNPILPIKISECRNEVAKVNIENKNNFRPLLGNHSRLNASDLIIDSNSVTTKFTYGGEFTLNYWIVKDTEKYSVFNNRSTPLLYTVNGQVQGTQNNRVLTNVGKPYLMDHIIVNVDCDKIQDGWKTRLFTSDRVRFAHNDQSDALQKQVESLLLDDENLDKWNTYFHDQLLSESTDNMSAELNKKIENKLKIYLMSGGIGNISTKKKKKRREEPFTNEEANKEFPTFISITNQNPCELEIGKDLSLNYISDADYTKYDLKSNINYSSNNDELISDIVARGFYKNGHGLDVFKISTDAKVGDEIHLKIFLNGYEDDENLSDSVLVKIVDKKPDKEKDETESEQKQNPNINVISLNKGDANYELIFGGKEDQVVDLKDNGESIDIYINMEIKSINKLIENIKLKEEDINKIKILKNEYIKQIAYYRLMLHYENKHSEEEIDQDKMNNECLRAAALITGMINDNLSVYIKETGDIDESSGNVE